MPVKPSPDRIYNYDLNYDTEVIKQRVDKRRERMLAKQTEAQAALAELEDRAKVVLGAQGAPTYAYPAYLNFCRELWKKSRKFHDQTLAKEAMVLQDKWTARELKKSILEVLRKEVFGIADPV
ncbi:MAG: hypothetical protein ABIL25_04090 [candidate division WOR-3 bacterium]